MSSKAWNWTLGISGLVLILAGTGLARRVSRLYGAGMVLLGIGSLGEAVARIAALSPPWEQAAEITGFAGSIIVIIGVSRLLLRGDVDTKSRVH